MNEIRHPPEGSSEIRVATLPRVLLTAMQGSPRSTIAQQLTGLGVAVTLSDRSGIDATALQSHALLVLEVEPSQSTLAQQCCRRWRLEMGDSYVPILCLTIGELSPEMLAAILDAGADACWPATMDSVTLAAQVRTLLRLHGVLARWSNRAAEAQLLNTRLQQAYQQMDGDLELARRIHRGFLPKRLPEVHSASFAVCYRPRSRIGGDFYDAFRLDEDYVGFYTADAMGRGVPASSLLSVFVKKSLRAKEITGRSYRLIPPQEVLEEINRELVALNLSETPFVTMLYGHLNCRDGLLTFARAAHPHPLYLPAQGEPTYWQSAGTLLGVFDAAFSQQVQQLAPGDRVLLTTDGVHGATPEAEAFVPSSRLLEAAATHRSLPLAAFVDRIASDLLHHNRQADDFTILALEYRG